jgi:hypothetical protein
MNEDFPFHQEYRVHIAAPAQTVFNLLDDHRRLTAHMEKPSLMMLGATMKTETDAQHGQAIGSLIQLNGSILGIALYVTEIVREYAPPVRKVWQTRGEPRLLVIGKYRMGFALTPEPGGNQLRIWIDYDTSAAAWLPWLARLLGSGYAKWCVRRMATDAANAFSEKVSDTQRWHA